MKNYSNPYSYRQQDNKLWFIKEYVVMFDDTDVFIVRNVWEEEVKLIVEKMNMAWQAGYNMGIAFEKSQHV